MSESVMPERGIPDSGIPDSGVEVMPMPDSGMPESGMPESGMLPNVSAPIGIPESGAPAMLRPSKVVEVGSGDPAVQLKLGFFACSSAHQLGCPSGSGIWLNVSLPRRSALMGVPRSKLPPRPLLFSGIALRRGPAIGSARACFRVTVCGGRPASWVPLSTVLQSIAGSDEISTLSRPLVPLAPRPRAPSVKLPTGELPSAMPESGVPDNGMPDSGIPERGMPESGMPDSGIPDSGMPESGEAAGGSTIPGIRPAGTFAGVTRRAPPAIAGSSTVMRRFAASVPGGGGVVGPAVVSSQVSASDVVDVGGHGGWLVPAKSTLLWRAESYAIETLKRPPGAP